MAQQTNEHAAWRKWLQPLLTAIIGLATAATIAINNSANEGVTDKMSKLETRVIVLESGISEIRDIKNDVKDLSASVNQLLGILSSQGVKKK